MGITHTNRTWIQTAPSLAAAALAVGVAALAIATMPSAPTAVAQPVTTINVNPGNVPTTAAGFDTISCDNLSPAAGQDGWLFVLGGPPNDGNGFVSVTATFSDASTYSVPPNGMLLTDGANPDFQKAALYTPAGLTLTAASALITDPAPNPPSQFQLSHTCPHDDTPQPTGSPSGTVTPTPTPSVSETPTPTPSVSETPTPTPSVSETPTPTPSVSETPTPTPSVSETPTPTPSVSETPTPTPSVSETPTPTPTVPTVVPTPGLPQTGADPAPAVGIALMMISFGSLLIVAVRRRAIP